MGLLRSGKCSDFISATKPAQNGGCALRLVSNTVVCREHSADTAIPASQASMELLLCKQLLPSNWSFVSNFCHLGLGTLRSDFSFPIIRLIQIYFSVFFHRKSFFL